MTDKKMSLTQEFLKSKNLLNLTESRIYLGMNRRDFELAEKFDPTFPPRKTKTKHSRVLLDQWLSTRSAPYFDKADDSLSGPHSARFRLQIDQLN